MTCHRKVQPGKKIMGLFIERIINCENLQDCYQACDYEKTFVCKGFNHRYIYYKYIFFSFTDKVYIYIKNIVLKIIFHFYIIEIRRIYSEKIKYLIKYFIKINNYLSQNISL